ncbi:MAG: ATP-binding protein [Bacteroides sp.]|nr:ATP-binding protein [Bacteroides sp.]
MKYPIGTQSFENLRTGGYVYVDKTDLVYKMVDEGRIYILCRPRRFGKSLLVSTLKAYFSGRRDLFEGLAIDKLEKEWAAYPVFHFDFNGANYEDDETALEMRLDFHLRIYEDIYGCDSRNTTLGDRFQYLLDAAYRQTGRKCVVLVDEYDKPILDALDTPMEDKNRNMLKGFYSTFKSADDNLRFVLLTGVTKFSQVSVFSGFNQPADISMNPDYDAICGITEEELFSVFVEPIARMADLFGYTVDETKRELKRMYDGYHFSNALLDIYNPFSLLNAFASKDFRDFWFASGTPAYLVKLLSHTRESINELTGKYYDAGMFADYKADVEQPLPMIYQSGYLTIKGYDREDRTYLLDFPNNEVRKGFLSVIAAGYFKVGNNDYPTTWCRESSRQLRKGEVSSFVTSMTAFLASIPYDAHPALKNIQATEKHFQYTFYLILRLMGTYCQLFIEKEYSQGRVDCIMEMKDYVYIFEFKLDGNADEAIAQINQRGYATPYIADARQVRKVGIVFSSESRTISEWKEE